MAIQALLMEVSQLETLYFASKSSALAEIPRLNKLKTEHSPDLEVPVYSVVPSYTPPNLFQVQRFLKKKYPRTLRETILVRVVSALEVYLVETIRLIFMARRDLFRRSEKIEFQYEEFLSAESLTELWTKVINQECRRLQNQGFDAFRKFFEQRFGINFAASPVPVSAIEELHDRRHILVHRLGRTDTFYRHKYNSSAAALLVNEEYLITACTNVKLLGNYIAKETTTLLQSANQSSRKPGDYVVKFELGNISDEAFAVLEDKYQFATSDDRLVSLDEILESRVGDEREYTLILHGKRDEVLQYERVIRSLKKNGKLLLLARDVLNHGRRASLTDEMIRIVASMLPPQRPWPTGIHKTIASALGRSKGEVSAAIDEILEWPGVYGWPPGI